MGVTSLTAVQCVAKTSDVAQIWLSITLVKNHTLVQNAEVASASPPASSNTVALTQVCGLISVWIAERPLGAAQTWLSTSECTWVRSPAAVLTVARLSVLAPS